MSKVLGAKPEFESVAPAFTNTHKADMLHVVTCIYHLHTGEVRDRRSLELTGQPGQIGELWV